MAERLPPLTRCDLRIVREVERSEGFLTVRRMDVSLTANGETSEPFRYDIVERKALDAAVIAAHFMRDGRRHVVLRSAFRPPFALDGEGRDAILWELPAGLIEIGEAPIAAAARELNEEVGTQLGPERLAPLGAAVIPVPAMIAERQWFFHVEIAPSEMGVATGDGSALERVSILATIALDDALALAREGKLPDAKSELALRRLKEVLA